MGRWGGDELGSTTDSLASALPVTSTLAPSLHHVEGEGLGEVMQPQGSQKKVEQRNSTNGFKSSSYRHSALFTACPSNTGMFLPKFLPKRLRPP